jgi:hypothetical protein
VAPKSDRDCDGRESHRLRARKDGQRRQDARLDAAEEVAEAPGDAPGEREERRDQDSGTGRVAAAASSAFAWWRTAASAVRAARPS